eukprot:CAMPEP_0113463242 /NCGR_PEP_ID=MMETSP0014_2-20120614/12538_1 /TAXON_ID=2857 /ORGANISM="Nitzschia sp." /LENGTH=190 /DNA_ID=CAMNT_0000355193 /DNA_START=57 /DNA_END=629 /DNA_ORIENTATION=- /assembly_acc=CAM_ASM_000159
MKFTTTLTSKAMLLMSMTIACLALSTTTTVDALAGPAKPAAVPKSALPTFNKKTQRWEAGKDAEEGYDVVGTLLRNGPVPTFTRLTNPDDYEQAVFKFQAKEKCNINQAQGNMDAYFENPNDWAFQRMTEERGGYKRDYGAPLDPKDVSLRLVWGGGITSYLIYLVSTFVSGDFCVSSPEAQFCKVFFDT